MDLALTYLVHLLPKLVHPLHHLHHLVKPFVDLLGLSLIDWLVSTTLCLACCCYPVLCARDESLLERICS